MRSFTGLAACLLLAAATTARAEVEEFVDEFATHPLGVVDHTNEEGALALGAHWMRMPVSWRFIEPTDDTFNWSSGLSSWLEAANAVGINGSIVVACNQFWATGHAVETDWPSYPPLDLSLDFDPQYGYSESYYDFISNLVTNYRDRIDRITIENEANTNVFWAGTSDDYRRLVATAEKAVEEHAPEILVLDSGVGSGSIGVAVATWMIESGTVDPEEILRFVNEYYEYDFYAPLNFDSYAEMAYWIQQPFVMESTKKVDSTLGAVAPHIDGLNFKFTNSAWLLPTVVEWFDRRLALYGSSIPLKINNEASNWPRGSATDEAQNLFKMVILGLANGVEQTIWFPYSDQLTNTPRVGLLDENGSETLQATAFGALSQFIGNAFAFSSQDTLGQNVHRFRFIGEGDARPALDVMWWDDGDHGSGSEMVTYELPQTTESVVKVEYLGQTTPLPGGSDLTTTVTHEGQMYVYTFTPVGVEPTAPVVPVVRQNAPNPFRSATTIEFAIPEAMDGQNVTIRVYDAGGRAVRTLASGPVSAGGHTAVWDGRDDRGSEVPAGSYWYRLTTAEGTSSKRMLLLR